MIGMLTGLVVTLYVRFFTSVAWTWYILLGTAATFLAGWLCSRGPLHKPAGSPR
jgi:hypothetical protein